MTPYYQDALCTIYHGDSREVLSTFEDDAFGLTLTDPPYGVDKAEWDGELPLWWMQDAARLAPVLGVMPGTRHLLDCPQNVGRLRYRWTLAVHINNGMTRSAFGFQAWFPCLVYAVDGTKIYRDVRDAKSISITGGMPDHPTPKPPRAISWLLSVLDTVPILDPFMGSGTILRAAKDLGRRAVGVEIEERYCEVAAKRLAQEVLMLDLPEPEMLGDQIALIIDGEVAS